jgi:phage baseplate assembly protein W
MSDIVNPHFKVPFTWGPRGSAEVVEQDSQEEVEQRIFAILNTRLGFRLEIPEFGLKDQLLTENGPSLTELEAAVLAWEPNAAYVLSEGRLQDVLSRYVNVAVERKAANG